VRAEKQPNGFRNYGSDIVSPEEILTKRKTKQTKKKGRS